MNTRLKQLSVLLNGILTGTLTKHKDGGLQFHYEKSWLETAGARPISLSLPLSNQPYVGDLVYHFFDNLLPDNELIRARIQRKFHTESTQPFDLLSSIGKDCVGAIQLIQGEAHTFKHEIKAEPISNKEIADLLKNYRTNPLGMANHNDDFRISIAGAQEKTAFLFHQNQWCKPIGETPTSHIFKLPIGTIQHSQIDLSDSCENEWLCLKIAEAFGLPTASSNIQLFNDVKVLVIERFDRKYASDHSWLMRLPQEDMCQALGISPNFKYQSDGGPGITEIMDLLLGSNTPDHDRELFFQTQILFWLLAAIDGHAKNFSLFIEPEGKYRMTPLYDILSAYPIIAKKQLQKQKIKMAMALKSESNHYRWNEIQKRHFIGAAKNARFSTSEAEKCLIQMLHNVDTVITTVSKQLPSNFPAIISDSIFEGMRLSKQRLEG
ncbi:MAG TPA: type II toxin-antitoxin system HipA family toxin [Gammaproteobacteria bacterium]|nr:type II toxin-antitoxin system HipA family toxin [Gammaproteobacteria bacterium]